MLTLRAILNFFKNLAHNSPFLCKFASCKNKMSNIMITYKKKTKEELIAGFKKAIEKKNQWEKQAIKEFADMRQNKINLSGALNS